MTDATHQASEKRLSFIVDEELAGHRLDVALASLAGISRAQARRWIDEGRVSSEAGLPRASRKVSFGDRFDAEPPVAVPSEMVAEPMELVIVFEDEDLIVIDKPAGLVVHPAPGHPRGTLVNGLLHHCRDLAGIGGVLRPGIVHRLDQGTSGIMVAAKRDEIHQKLSLQFQEHSIERIYHAFVRGLPGADEGRIDRAIGRHQRDRKRMSVRSRSGKEAQTNWRVLERFTRSGITELEIRPETGRTHQIRVHLSSIGLPLVADPVYGRERGQSRKLTRSLGRPALHARVLGFEHPRNAERLRFEAALPPDLRALRETLSARERTT